MKVRKGFVSNSSSSSFIVVGHSSEDDALNRYDPNDGNYTFGWGPDTYHDITSRINWVMILAENDEAKKDMVKEVVKKHSKECSDDGFKAMHRLLNDEEWVDYAYIDHQSNCDELGLFEDAKLLERFIMDKESHIIEDNDNH